MTYFLVSSDLLFEEMGAKLESNGAVVSGGRTDSGWRESCMVDPLLIIDVVNTAIESQVPVVGNDDDDEADADGVGLTMVFIKRTGTSSVK